MPSGVQSVAWLFCNFLDLKPVAFFIHRCYLETMIQGIAKLWKEQASYSNSW
jgi:hypothetical protein